MEDQTSANTNNASQIQQKIASLLRDIHEQPLDTLSIEQYRAAFETIPTLYTMQSEVTIKTFSIQDLAAEWIIPVAARTQQAILYFHSGTYINGSLHTDRVLVSALAAMTRTRILQIDYRLAPEHPFPAPIEDGLTAYQWLQEQGYANKNLAIMGSAAGGGIALAVLLLARDQKIPLPTMAACISPWLDLTTTGLRRKSQLTTDTVLSLDLLEYAASQYVNQAEAAQPLASPMYADLHGLPALFLQVGQLELLHDDAYKFKELATTAGVRARCVTMAGMFHGWHAFADQLPAAQGHLALDQIAAYFEKYIALANGTWPDTTATYRQP
ncbi:hypothetical protein KDW_49030 [Dictyobacter vulcani]|uniref:Alpha/beta hydrolase fold-3 domain-containing protein n=1 Tax=Dictyobacter vulcani TaxID=2607529 RepID=A0A5J4KW88_9CHLR|nr:alpha/beta hydrolase [Dictyobacter vulcani]GER90741.1 hypothetical protein KDW_49030 [Dictyobacter vulcani]